MKKWISICVIIGLLATSVLPLSAAEGNAFSDVPRGHWAESVVNEAQQLGITDGLGDGTFGLGQTITRGEFAALLVKLMQWPTISPSQGSFADNQDVNAWYYVPIETAFSQNMMTKTENFRPLEPITREEMAVLMVGALGYSGLGEQMRESTTDFSDVNQNKGFITIAKDLGLISGTGGNTFAPSQTATREEAVSMMVRMYHKLENKLTTLHGFYAIKSADQSAMMKEMDSVSFGWSRLELEKGQVSVNLTGSNKNTFVVPTGFAQVVAQAKAAKATTQLMVFADDRDQLNQILTEPTLRTQGVEAIISQVNATAKDGELVSFDGVVIDFEGMKGESLKQGFNQFLIELKSKLGESGKTLYVAVHPKRQGGQAYFDAYDYPVIGQVADKVILMVGDYYAKSLTSEEMAMGYTKTPLSPLDEVYYALKAITAPNTGVGDNRKILVQFSMDTVQWKLQNGQVINQIPYHPTYDAVAARLNGGKVVDHYPNFSYNPYATYYDESDNTENVLWYEDARSIGAKMELARLFGTGGISLWRIGNIPEDVWAEVTKVVE